MPLLLIGYVVNTLDKLNVGFAGLEMNRALGFSPEVFGLGAGLFFVTYTIFEIPSNLLLRRFGARVWLGRILISWGIVSAATACVYDQTSFYVLRLVLGVAEAGWFPGVIFFLSLWFPARWRARAIMWFFLGSPIAAVFGGPISGAILSMPPIAGLANWQWLFIIEGIPAVILGIVILALLRDSPAKAAWLDPVDRAALTTALETERREAEIASRGGSKTGLFVAQVAFLGAMNFFSAVGLYGSFIWIPRLVKDFGDLSNLQVGFLTAVPFFFSGLALIACGYSSDRYKERKWHVSGMFLLSAVGFLGASLTLGHSSAGTLAMMTVAKMGLIGAQGAFFAMISEMLRSSRPGSLSLASGLATITMIGNLGGFVGPYGIGLLLSAFGSFGVPLLILAMLGLLVSATLACSRSSFLGAQLTTAVPMVHEVTP